MPILKLETNVETGKIPQDFLSSTSALTAKILGKPESVSRPVAFIHFSTRGVCTVGTHRTAIVGGGTVQQACQHSIPPIHPLQENTGALQILLRFHIVFLRPGQSVRVRM